MSDRVQLESIYAVFELVRCSSTDLSSDHSHASKAATSNNGFHNFTRLLKLFFLHKSFARTKWTIYHLEAVIMKSTIFFTWNPKSMKGPNFQLKKVSNRYHIQDSCERKWEDKQTIEQLNNEITTTCGVRWLIAARRENWIEWKTVCIIYFPIIEKAFTMLVSCCSDCAPVARLSHKLPIQ